MLRCPCHTKRFDPDGPSFIRTISKYSGPTRPYKRTVPWIPVHWGQLKLLISEIEFLTPYFGLDFHVVYAGAAPGVHMPILAKLFESMHFILVDPAPSMIRDSQYKNIEVIKGFMTDDLALHFSNQYKDKILFISDVRVGSNDSRESDQAQQVRIQKDMEAQEGWMKIMCPLSSILKFRLPWSVGNGKTLYPDGRIFLPVYGKELTHEARLVVDRWAPNIQYRNKLYEGQMAYFNQVLRPALYPSKNHILKPNIITYNKDSSRTEKKGQVVQGEKKCYDCTAFQMIVREYLLKSGNYMEKELDYTAINTECENIEQKLGEYVNEWETIRPKPATNLVHHKKRGKPATQPRPGMTCSGPDDDEELFSMCLGDLPTIGRERQIEYNYKRYLE